MTAAALAIVKVGLGHANVAARAFRDKQTKESFPRNMHRYYCYYTFGRLPSIPGVPRARTTTMHRLSIYFCARDETSDRSSQQTLTT